MAETEIQNGGRRLTEDREDREGKDEATVFASLAISCSINSMQPSSVLRRLMRWAMIRSVLSLTNLTKRSDAPRSNASRMYRGRNGFDSGDEVTVACRGRQVAS